MQGVFSNVTSPSTKAKLRILFEVAPLGLLVEKAGGVSSADGKQQSVRIPFPRVSAVRIQQNACPRMFLEVCTGIRN